jgi:hypothetical protein
MTATSDTVPASDSRLGSLSTVGKIKFVAFTLVALAVIALNVVLTPAVVLNAAYLGWTTTFGTHQVHDMTIRVVLWLAFLVPMALLLYRPKARVNTVQVPLVAIPIAVMAFLAGSELLPGFATVSVLAVALHPAGRSALRFDRVETVDRRLAAVFAVGAVPLLVYGILEVGAQVSTADEHTLFVHYGAMGIAAFVTIAMGALAVLRQRDWRFAAWNAGPVAAAAGIFSIGFPDVASSLGVVGGALLVLWAIVFVARVESGRRRDVDPEDELVDETTVRPI